MTVATVVTLSVTVTLAFIGYVATYRNNLRLDRQKARLERVNLQLSDFYGPLLANAAASGIAWLAFRSRYRPTMDSFWGGLTTPTADEAAAWRLWMKEVFMPLNLRMEAVVVERADLLEESEMPQALLLLCAHVEAYKTVLKQWDEGDYSEHASVINFPAEEVQQYARDRFTQLKSEQLRLLGVLQQERPAMGR